VSFSRHASKVSDRIEIGGHKPLCLLAQLAAR